MNQTFFLNSSFFSDCETRINTLILNCKSFNVWLNVAMSLGFAISLIFLTRKISKDFNLVEKYILIWNWLEPILFVLSCVEFIICLKIIFSF